VLGSKTSQPTGAVGAVNILQDAKLFETAAEAVADLQVMRWSSSSGCAHWLIPMLLI